MVSLKQINEFLIKANKPHAFGTAVLEPQTNGSRTINFVDGDFSMEDNFFGGEPYGGQQVVFYKNEPIWICVYYGQVTSNKSSGEDVYSFLGKALQNPDDNERPYRGPAKYEEGNMEYRNQLEGDTANFAGRESILEDGKEVYWAKYMGGLVDRRFKGSV